VWRNIIIIIILKAHQHEAAGMIIDKEHLTAAAVNSLTRLVIVLWTEIGSFPC